MTEHLHPLELVEVCEREYGPEYAWGMRALLWCWLEDLVEEADFRRLGDRLLDPDARMRGAAWRSLWLLGHAQSFIRAGRVKL